MFDGCYGSRREVGFIWNHAGVVVRVEGVCGEAGKTETQLHTRGREGGREGGEKGKDRERGPWQKKEKVILLFVRRRKEPKEREGQRAIGKDRER